MIIIDLKIFLFALVLLIITVIVMAVMIIYNQSKTKRSSTAIEPLLSIEFLKDQQIFIGQLVHELRTPLTSMLVHLDVSRNGIIDDNVRQNSLSIAYQETERMNRLVRDLTELYYLKTTTDISLMPVDLTLIVEEAIAQLYSVAEHRSIYLSFAHLE